MKKHGILVALLLVGCGGDNTPGGDVGACTGDDSCVKDDTGGNGDTCMEGDTKGIEGQPACDAGPPAAGSCSCVNGEWDCWFSCHMECPTTFGPSTEGTACTFDDHYACTYMNLDPKYALLGSASCSCVAGKLSCDCGGVPCEFCKDGDTRSDHGSTCDQAGSISTTSTCVDGGWEFVAPCHYECPKAYDVTVPGSACSFTTEAICSYVDSGTGDTMVCDCVDSKLVCHIQS